MKNTDILRQIIREEIQKMNETKITEKSFAKSFTQFETNIKNNIIKVIVSRHPEFKKLDLDGIISSWMYDTNNWKAAYYATGDDRERDVYDSIITKIKQSK